MLCAAYGTGLLEDVARARMGGEDAGAPETCALIQGMRLSFRGGIPVMEPHRMMAVPAGIWRIGESAAARLDMMEGFPLACRRRRLDPGDALTLGSELDEPPVVWEPVFSSAWRDDAPDAETMDICANGYVGFGLERWLWVLEAARQRALGNRPLLLSAGEGQPIACCGSPWGFGPIWAGRPWASFESWKASLDLSDGETEADGLMRRGWRPVAGEEEAMRQELRDLAFRRPALPPRAELLHGWE